MAGWKHWFLGRLEVVEPSPKCGPDNNFPSSFILRNFSVNNNEAAVEIDTVPTIALKGPKFLGFLWTHPGEEAPNPVRQVAHHKGQGEGISHLFQCEDDDLLVSFVDGDFDVFCWVTVEPLVP